MTSEICHQDHLYKALKVLFPHLKIIQNARKTAKQVINTSTGYPQELDCWIPDLLLGFEFQDAYHYVAMWYVNVPLDVIKEKDEKKQKTVHMLGSTVITVPCWWHATNNNLVATILFHRPDLESQIGHASFSNPQQSLPIPLNPPSLFFSQTRITGIGELMLASFVSTISNLSPILFEHSFWWLGEKYDGIHCVWVPKEHRLYTRREKQIKIEVCHLRLLGGNLTCAIEGEIWNGRGMFSESQKIVERVSLSELPFMRVIAFDSPSLNLQKLPYEGRYHHMLSLVPCEHPFLNISFRRKCYSILQLHKTLNSIIDEGGEGVMIRMPMSKYEPGRSTLLIKFKASLGDSEALVVSVEDDQVNLQLPNGTTFEFQQIFNKNEPVPKKGDIVTIEYDNFVRKDVPANPKIVRIRADLSWEDVLYDFVSNSPHHDGKTLAFITKPTGYWTKNNGKNLRLFLEDFTRKRNLDPLLTETWYNISGRLFEDTKVRYVIYQEGSFVNTLVKIFPELNFDVCKFTTLPKGHFKVVANRKYFFDTIAQSRNFNPRIPENWYTLPPAVIFDKTEAFFIGTYYQGSYQDALLHIYPDIGLESKKFSYQPYGLRDKVAFRKRFFERYAKSKGFNPLIPENWYTIDDKDVKAQKHSVRTLQDYAQSVSRALISVFPNIGLVIDKFRFLPRGYWTKHRNRKQFFDDYARSNGFDPLVGSNWLKQPYSQFLAVKNAHAVMHYYKGNFRKAVNQIYPNLGIMQLQPKGHWANKNVQRDFFDSFARERGFDPLKPDNWYNVSYYALTEHKHAASIIAHFGSMKSALVNIYPDINLNISKFRTVTHYKHKSNRKLFFDKYAAENGFDPFFHKNWSRLESSFLLRPGARHLLKYYNGSVQKALDDLYPNTSTSSSSSFDTLAT
eukprot:Phypoly_transcript_00218.p2 GENE.Phypoly_transcript_00218~~Phypoly_transcript_00218.p2  ORF type:complete len:903 (-),score=85.00 Phypoly_transcript_00218:118-2826(-)